MATQPREIQRYITPDGRVPFDEWFYSLRDFSAKVKIEARFDRVSRGNLGDCRSGASHFCNPPHPQPLSHLGRGENSLFLPPLPPWERGGTGGEGDNLCQNGMLPCRSVGEGVFELSINFSPGYRIYFGQVGSSIVLLLCGGDKSTQDQDIRKAKEYWTDYRSQDNA